jgi:hypothetical protein
LHGWRVRRSIPLPDPPAGQIGESFAPQVAIIQQML